VLFIGAAPWHAERARKGGAGWNPARGGLGVHVVRARAQAGKELGAGEGMTGGPRAAWAAAELMLLQWTGSGGLPKEGEAGCCCELGQKRRRKREGKLELFPRYLEKKKRYLLNSNEFEFKPTASSHSIKLCISMYAQKSYT